MQVTLCDQVPKAQLLSELASKPTRPLPPEDVQRCASSQWPLKAANTVRKTWGKSICLMQLFVIVKPVWPLLARDCWLGQKLKGLDLRTHLLQETVLTFYDMSAFPFS